MGWWYRGSYSTNLYWLLTCFPCSSRGHVLFHHCISSAWFIEGITNYFRINGWQRDSGIACESVFDGCHFSLLPVSVDNLHRGLSFHFCKIRIIMVPVSRHKGCCVVSRNVWSSLNSVWGESIHQMVALDILTINNSNSDAWYLLMPRNLLTKVIRQYYPHFIEQGLVLGDLLKFAQVENDRVLVWIRYIGPQSPCFFVCLFLFYYLELLCIENRTLEVKLTEYISTVRQSWQ